MDKIDKNILSSNEDAYICYEYVREQKSQIFRHEEIDYFELVESGIIKYKNIGKVYVTGDFNSRTGQCTDLPDYLRYDNYLTVGMNENRLSSHIPLRSSRDVNIDNYGCRLLDLCKSTGLIKANGRLSEDSSVGEFTCINARGRSVVDYFLLAHSDFDTVSYFSICEIDEFSDHCALYICLKTLSHKNNTTDNPSQSSENKPLKKLVWSCENEEHFRNTILSGIEKYTELISSLDDDRSSLDNVAGQFSSLLFNDAYQHFGKTIHTEGTKGSTPHNNNNPWFDNTCKTEKQTFNRAKHEYSRCRSDLNRTNLTKCRT